MISIAALIYRSVEYGDWFYQSLLSATPELHSGEARFFFVANNATPEVLSWLREEGVPHEVCESPERDEKWLFDNLKIGSPVYMHYVYRGWNHALHCSDETTVLVNSDHYFHAGWLPKLLQHHNETTWVSPKSFEPRLSGRATFKKAIRLDAGEHPTEFKAAQFHAAAEAHSKPGQIENGGAYMPVVMNTALALSMGGYPEGNIAGNAPGSRSNYGDRFFFNLAATRHGVRHITALDSFVYHFNEGEMRWATG